MVGPGVICTCVLGHEPPHLGRAMRGRYDMLCMQPIILHFCIYISTELRHVFIKLHVHSFVYELPGTSLDYSCAHISHRLGGKSPRSSRLSVCVYSAYVYVCMRIYVYTQVHIHTHVYINTIRCIHIHV